MMRWMVMVLVMVPSVLMAHHYKGLPHYGYFENYPQVPVDEYLAQAGDYELSLVVYDFQGMEKSDVHQPDDARLYLIIYNLRAGKAYQGRCRLEILDGTRVVHMVERDKAEQESLYLLNRELSEDGDWNLRVTLLDEDNLTAIVPFLLTSQKTNWGLTTAIVVVVLVVVAAVGSRRARVLQDRRDNRRLRNVVTHAT